MEPERDPEGVEVEYLARTGALRKRKVLEIGCGNGRLIWRYGDRAKAIAGVDPDFEPLTEAAASRPEALATPLLLAHAEAQALPFANEVFESAIFAWSL
jgi:ubiquinone/menaquinone biosynthesis C-methylase UbiE